MRILMVCLGNICRSPLAQGILESKCTKAGITSIVVDSAGTGDYHIGNAPDHRSVAVAKANGIDISKQKCRQITKADLDQFDMIIAMDDSNKKNIVQLASNAAQREKVDTLLNIIGTVGNSQNVPDPYYDGKFEEVYTLLDMAIDRLLNQLLVEDPLISSKLYK